MRGREVGREGGMDVYVYGDIENPDFWQFWSKIGTQMSKICQDRLNAAIIPCGYLMTPMVGIVREIPCCSDIFFSVVTIFQCKCTELTDCTIP